MASGQDIKNMSVEDIQLILKDQLDLYNNDEITILKNEINKRIPEKERIKMKNQPQKIKCQKCDAPNPFSNEKCMYCGCTLDKTIHENEIEDSCEDESNSDLSGFPTYICEYCNNELTDQMIDQGFCFECGKPIHFKTVQEIYDEETINKEAERIEQNKKIEKLYKNLKSTTGFNFEGYKITDYIKIISAETVLGTGFLSEFSAGISDLFGTENDSFSDKLETAKESSIQKLFKKAILLKANAIIGIDFDYVNFSGNMIGVIANGTAVTIEKLML